MDNAIMIVYNNRVGRGMLAWMEALDDKGVQDGACRVVTTVVSQI